MILKYFPDKYWAMAIPLYLFALIFCIMLMFIGLALFYSKKKVVTAITTATSASNADKSKVKTT